MDTRNDPVGELDAVIRRKYCTDRVGHGGDQVAQEPCGCRLVRIRVQLDMGKFAGTVDGDEQA
jgi:hypothetical protein